MPGKEEEEPGGQRESIFRRRKLYQTLSVGPVRDSAVTKKNYSILISTSNVMGSTCNQYYSNNDSIQMTIIYCNQVTSD